MPIPENDKYSTFSDTVSSPATKCFLITPHTTIAIVPVPKAVRFDTAGTVTFRAVDSEADVTMNVLAGETLDIRMQFIRAAGTTVTAIHALA